MSNILIWNARGVANLATFRRLQNLCRLHSLSILVLIEPIVVVDRLPQFCSRLGFQHSFTLPNNKVWVFWRHSFVVVLLVHSDQYVHFKMSHPAISNNFYSTFVYAKHKQTELQLL